MTQEDYQQQANKALELLKAMGATSQEVKDFLKSQGIGGVALDPHDCPIARYLRLNGIEACVTGNKLILGDHSTEIHLPECVREFITKYDASFIINKPLSQVMLSKFIVNAINPFSGNLAFL